MGLPFLSMTSYCRYIHQQLYAVVPDVDSYASFIPFDTHLHIVCPLTCMPAMPNAEAELMVAFSAFTKQYMSREMCVPYEFVKVHFPIQYI